MMMRRAFLAGLASVCVMSGLASLPSRGDDARVRVMAVFGGQVGDAWYGQFFQPYLTPGGRFGLMTTVYWPQPFPQGTTVPAIYREAAGGGMQLAARQGLPRPEGDGSLGSVGITAIDRFRMTDAGRIGLVADVFLQPPGQPAIYGQGIYISEPNGSLTKVIRTGDPFGNGTASTTFFAPALNEAGQVAFTGDIEGVGFALGRAQVGGAIMELTRTGGTMPDGMGEIYWVGPPKMNSSGQIAVPVRVNDFLNDAYLRSDAQGRLSVVVRNGQPSPDGIGKLGRLLPAGSDRRMTLNDAGQMLIEAGTEPEPGLPARSMLIRAEPDGRLSVIAATGHRLADSTGTEMVLGGAVGGDMNGRGDVSFVALGPAQAIGRVLADGTAGLVARPGQSTPDARHVYYALSGNTAINAEGLVAFASRLALPEKPTDTVGTGIFLSDGRDVIELAATGTEVDGYVLTEVSVLESMSPVPRIALDDAGRVAFFARGLKDGVSNRMILMATPDSHWRGPAGASWEQKENWKLGLSPSADRDVRIGSESDAGASVAAGPAFDAVVRSITVGSESGGMAELRLQRGVKVSTADGTRVLNAGLLRGEGEIVGGLVNHGRVAVGEPSAGMSAGTLVADAYTQGDEGVLSMDVGKSVEGDAPSSWHDVLDVRGLARLDGTLEISTSGVDVLVDGGYPILIYQAREGTFDELVVPDLGGGRRFELVYTPTAAVLVVVPEPSAVMVVAGMSMAVSCRRGGSSRLRASARHW